MENHGKKYRILAVDLDGTLLNNEEDISDKNAEAVFRAKEAGTIVVITTGRSISSAMKFIKRLHSCGPCITYNGAVIRNGEHTLRELLLEEGVVKELVTGLKGLGQNPILYTLDDMRFYDELGDQTENFFNFSRGLEDRIIRVKDLSSRRWRGIIRISIFTDEKKISILEKEISSRYGRIVRSTRTYFPVWDFWIYEILNPEATKSSGLAYICNLHGIRREEVIAVGDNLNDLDMLEWAGLGVAMKNALPDVIERADYVTSRSNDEDGVAEVIEKFILNPLERHGKAFQGHRSYPDNTQ